ncbi:hypothetical protein [Streptomyces sp. NPDC095613]|uniref:hypothetical protein n=1 Tax=Streptomyces sp. NPDC095613 TaxID=3155540 RepID=UPI003333EFDC
MPASREQQAEVAARRAELIRLRRAGVRFEDPQIQNLGYTSRGAASKDFIRALTERRDEQAAEASVYRQEENERLDALLESVWPSATSRSGGEGEVDLRAVEAVLKIMDRRAKLNGLDMPVKTELSGPNGGSIPLGDAGATELERLMGLAGNGEDDDLLAPNAEKADADDDGDHDRG